MALKSYFKKEITSKPSLSDLIIPKTTTKKVTTPQTVTTPKTEEKTSLLSSINKGISKIGETVGGIATEFVTAPQKAGTQLGLYASKKLTGEEKTYKPQTKIGKAMLGEEVKDVEKTGQEYLTGVGLQKETAEKYGLGTGLVFATLDLLPATSGEAKLGTKAIKMLAKEKDVAKIAKVLKTTGASDDIIKPLAEKISKTSNTKIIKNSIDDLTKQISEAKITKEVKPTVSKIEDIKPQEAVTAKKAETVAKEEPLIKEAKKYKSAEEFINKSGIVPEWGTKNQYFEMDPNRDELLKMLDTGEHNPEVYAKSDRWEMNQVLKDKPAFLNNNVPDEEVIQFAKDNNLPYAKDEYGEIIIAKNEELLNDVLNAKNQRELGLALGYEDIGVLGNGKPRLAKQQLTDIWNKANKPQKALGEVKPTKLIEDTAKAEKAVKMETTADKIVDLKKFKNENIASKATKAKAEIREIGSSKFNSLDIPKETKLEFLQRKIQDKMNRLGVIQKEITKAGGKVEEASDAYLKQELFYGRVGNKIDKFEKDIVEPLIKKIKASNVTIDELGDYLYALHATERNSKIAKVNKNLLKGGSGMTDEEAKAILVGFDDAGKTKDLKELADDFYRNITNKRLQILKESGLEKEETIKLLEEGYKNYVPLKGKAGVTSKGKIGQGFSITGKDIKRAFGRGSKADNPFVQALVDYQETLIRAEKNEVSKSLLKLAEDNPNPKLWEVESVRYTPKYDKTGEVVSLDPHYKFADNVLQVKVDGKTKLITIKDPQLANAMKGLGTERGIGVLNNVNNLLRSINTTLNPEFIITNFQRDIQTAGVNIAGEQSTKMMANTVKNIPKAMKGIWRNLRKGDTSSEWAKVYEELKAEGGKTGFFDMKNIDEKKKQLEKTIKLYNSNNTTAILKNTVNVAGEYIDNMNEMVEMAVRTSAYKEAINNGMTKKQAASIAKNLTVNFNKKGELGPLMNSLYLFSNAGIQGSARVLSALKHKKVQKIVAGIAAGSFMLDELNRNINEKEFNKISDYEKNSNIIIMNPDGSHFKIALPYGFNIFKITGDVLNEAYHKDTTVGEAGKRLLLAMNDTYNPISSGTTLQTLAPTVLDPFVQAAENKTYSGSPIKPEQSMFGAKKKQSSLYWDSVRPTTKEFTDWLNNITGGTEVEAGYLDISPEIVDNYIDNVTGGTGKFIANTLNTGYSAAVKKEIPELNNIPFVRKVIAEPSEYWETSTIRELKDKSGTQELSEKEISYFKQAIKDGIEKGNIDKESAVKSIKELTKNQAKIRASRVYEEIKNATPDEKKKAIGKMTSEEKSAFIDIIKSQAE